MAENPSFLSLSRLQQQQCWRGVEGKKAMEAKNKNSNSNNTSIKTSCRAVTNIDQNRPHHHSKVPPKSSPISYFLNISINTNKSRALNESIPPTFRIKIPKVLAKNVKKKELHHHNNRTTTTTAKRQQNNEASFKTKMWVNPKRLLQINKVTSLFSGFKKPEGTSVSHRHENCSNVGRNIAEERHHQTPFKEEKQRVMLNKNTYIGSLEDSAESSSSSFQSVTSSLFSLNINGDYSDFLESNSLPLSDINHHHPTENLKIKHEEEEEEDDDEEDQVGFNGTCSSTFRLPNKTSSSLKRFLNKKTSSLRFINMGRSSSISSNNICCSEGGDDVEIKEEEVRRKSCGSDRIKGSIWMPAGTTGKKVFFNRNKKNESDDDDTELWKKRILMGERCRPLSFSEFVESSPRQP